MSIKTDGNSPAQPTIEQSTNDYHWTTTDGLTKREHFAAMAMQGLLVMSKGHHLNDCAVLAVEAADKLIEVLNSKPNED